MDEIEICRSKSVKLICYKNLTRLPNFRILWFGSSSGDNEFYLKFKIAALARFTLQKYFGTARVKLARVPKKKG